MATVHQLLPAEMTPAEFFRAVFEPRHRVRRRRHPQKIAAMWQVARAIRLFSSYVGRDTLIGELSSDCIEEFADCMATEFNPRLAHQAAQRVARVLRAAMPERFSVVKGGA